MLPIALGWVSFAIVVLVILVFCYAVVKYYSDRHESERLPTIVTVVALAVTLMCVFIIPVDILNVSTTRDSAGNQIVSTADIDSRSESIQALYYTLYMTILVFAFIIIPFTYFYYEEFDEDTTTKERIWAGVKYTLAGLVIIIILLVIGILIKPGKLPDSHGTKEWVDYIVDSSNRGEGSITFAIACLTVLGFTIWITYTAYGLSAFPIGLMKGKRHIAEEASDLQGDLEETKEQKRALNSKYLGGRTMNDKDRRRLDILERQERILSRRTERIAITQRGFARVVSVCKPFAFIFGIFFFLVTLLIVISVLLTDIDKISNSCGPACGFISKYPKIANPIDLLLSKLAPYFPLDYIVLGSIIVFIFFCTLSGIIRIGIRFLWVHLYTIKAKRTAPQGLLLATILLMLAILALNVEILTLAPRYATYGNQVYRTVNGTIADCSILAPPTNCTMTQIGTLMARIQLSTAFFGNVYYYASWAFIAAFFVGAIISLIKRKSSNIETSGDDSDEEEY